ncbi:hypothetical protein B0T16DRAFT_514790 [Cercophora newfieldiana]|uniref:Uncharacterized protein n=1 Tax=Cercophora newfieldiana TaxID=92897 RepID=A0AA39XWT5_9PEZI|nr:hypothetical protein B0T16DRAFT_514790 [Cercophora newfieldiana]
MSGLTTVYKLLQEHPTNPVHNPQYVTGSDKNWAQRYPAISNLIVHTTIDGNNCTRANFDQAFLPLDGDDTMLRTTVEARRPNERAWRLESEADCELWFHTEISNVVLSAWNQFPPVTQCSHIKPPREDSIAEEVDTMYCVKDGGVKTVIAIGEMKRNLINSELWQIGDISSSSRQEKLSKELRGYAVKYQCPQVYCFDGETLLLLQFQATREADIADANCRVDCWVIPRENSYITFREALYRLLVQGLRRLQGNRAQQHPTLGSFTSPLRQFYNGRPAWRTSNGRLSAEPPEGYYRVVDVYTGVMKWVHEQDSDFVLWETDSGL